MQRSRWNGKGMFIFMRPEDVLKIGAIPIIKSLPQAVKDYFTKEDLKRPLLAEAGVTPIRFTSYICMKTADGSIFNGWTPNILDMMAEDWTIFEV